MRARWKNLRREQRGASLVELALVLPLFMFMIAGIVDLGRAFNTFMIITNASREGARYGIIHPWDTAGVENATRALATGLDGTLLTINTTWPSGTVRVEVTYVLNLLTGPFIEAVGGSPTITLQAMSTMRLE